MGKGRFEKPSMGKFPVVTVVLAVICVVLVILLLQTCQHTPENSSESTVPETTVVKNEGSIFVDREEGWLSFVVEYEGRSKWIR